ncbi:hypothetical protein C1645_747617 [Glomus cerebriforme]|uniref:GIY-YIG domain-containing protein n=1 Tax=Glomus cerebriforme TaxID=658196 RepID=A0A397TP30_9GLOM|nr:hypothetical protein C1645_747617 [Glomus cerebriforme]
MIIVYVLECSDGKYYVGKTSRSINIEHCNGSGSEWTRIYRPIRIVENEQTDDNAYSVLNKTLDYMSKYGIDSVRSDRYSEVYLSIEEKKNIKQLLLHKNDSCYDQHHEDEEHQCYRCGGSDPDKCDDYHVYEYYDYSDKND